MRNTQLFSVKVCGLPDILSPPQNLSLEVGDRASFLCTVDMSCLVSYVEWYRHNNNGKPCKWAVNMRNKTKNTFGSFFLLTQSVIY